MTFPAFAHAPLTGQSRYLILPNRQKEEIILAAANLKYRVNQENLESLVSYRQDLRSKLEWQCLFVLPEWIKVWWTAFNNGAEAHARQAILSIRRKEELMGLAPLQVSDGRASFIGNTDVCDNKI